MPHPRCPSGSSHGVWRFFPHPKWRSWRAPRRPGGFSENPNQNRIWRKKTSNEHPDRLCGYRPIDSAVLGRIVQGFEKKKRGFTGPPLRFSNRMIVWTSLCAFTFWGEKMEERWRHDWWRPLASGLWYTSFPCVVTRIFCDSSCPLENRLQQMPAPSSSLRLSFNLGGVQI